MKKLAYLAPEIPSLSATFVFNEIIEVQKCGVEVVCFSVHRPTHVSEELAHFVETTCYLYANRPKLFITAFWFAMRHPRLFFSALGWLFSDMAQCGLSLQSLKLASQFVAAAGMARALMMQGCQHLHIHFAHVPTQIGMYAAKLAGIPFSVMAHANDIFERPLLLKEKAQRSKVFLTISEFNRNYLLSLGLDASKLHIVRCGVALATKHEVRAFESRSVCKLGSLGRFVEKKGMDVLIHALAILNAQQAGKFHLSIAGDGPDKAALEHLVDTLKLKHMVDFKGALKHSEVATWLNTIDVFVLACKVDKNGDMDGIPVVLMEAMSQYVPVISTRISGIPELVKHGETGLLAEPNNAQSLAEQILDLLKNTEMVNRYTADAYSYLQHEFSLHGNANRLLQYVQ